MRIKWLIHAYHSSYYVPCKTKFNELNEDQRSYLYFINVWKNIRVYGFVSVLFSIGAFFILFSTFSIFYFLPLCFFCSSCCARCAVEAVGVVIVVIIVVIIEVVAVVAFVERIVLIHLKLVVVAEAPLVSLKMKTQPDHHLIKLAFVKFGFFK